MTTIIAKNQTGSPVALSQLSIPDGVIAASGQVDLTLYNLVREIQEDADLLAKITSNDVLLNDGTNDLTKEQSLELLASPIGVKHNLIATTDPGASDDKSAGYSAGVSLWLNTTTKTTFRCKEDDVGAAVWTDLTSGPPPALANTVQMVVAKDSSSTSYETLLEFEYGGSTAWGTLTSITIIASRLTDTFDLRVYDATNAMVIAESLGISSPSSAIHDMGTISNLPAGQAIFEVQAKRIGGGASNTVLVNSMALKF